MTTYVDVMRLASELEKLIEHHNVWDAIPKQDELLTALKDYHTNILKIIAGLEAGRDMCMKDTFIWKLYDGLIKQFKKDLGIE